MAPSFVPRRPASPRPARLLSGVERDRAILFGLEDPADDGVCPIGLGPPPDLHSPGDRQRTHRWPTFRWPTFRWWRRLARGGRSSQGRPQ